MATNFWSDKIQLLLKGIRFKGGATIDSTTRQNLTYTDSLGTKLLKKDNYELYFEDFKDTFPVAYFNEAVSMTKVNETDSSYASNTVGRINQTGATTSQFVETNPIDVIGADWSLEPIKLEVMQSVTGIGTWSMVLMTSTDGISYTANTSAVEITDKKNYKLILQLASDITHVKVRWIIGTPDNATILRIGRVAIMSNAFAVGQTTVFQNYVVDRGTIKNSDSFFIFNVSGSGISTIVTAIKEGNISLTISPYVSSTGLGSYYTDIILNGSIVKREHHFCSGSGIGFNAPASVDIDVSSGDIVTFATSVGITNVSMDFNATAYADNVIVDAQIEGSVGQIVTHAGNSVPQGTLLAEGLAVSRTTYSDLFSAIGTTYGIGDGSTTFNLPDYRGYFLRGWSDDATIDPDGPRAVGSTQLDDFKSHNHNIASANAGGSGGQAGPINAGGTLNVSFNTGLRGGLETRPKNKAVKYYIRYAKKEVILSLDVSSERENVYSARIANNGTASITSQSSSFIESVTRSSVGTVSVVFKSGFFSVPPVVVGLGAFPGRTATSNTPTTSGVTIYMQVSGTNADEDRDFSIALQRQLSDYRPPKAFIAGQVALTEANTSGIEYRTNEKMDGQWVYARTFFTTATTATSFTIGTFPVGSTTVSLESLIKDNSNLWRPAYYNDDGTRAEVSAIESTGLITMNLNAFTVNGTRTIIKYLK